MKTLLNTVTELDELVFENRNKNYGAYALRESYSKDLTRGLLIGTAIILAFFGTVYGIHYANINIETPQEAIITLHPVDMTPEKKDEPKKIAEAIKPPKTPVTPPSKTPEQPVVTTPPAPATTVPIVADSSQNLGKPNELAGNGKPGSIGTNPNGGNGKVGDTTTTTVIPTEPVTFADTMPENPGLNRFLVSNIKYPRVAREEGIEGVVYVAFVVGTDGSVSRVSIEKSVHPLLDNEAKRVAAIIPKWKPAKMNGHSVPFLYRLPIRFRLN